MCGPSGAGSSPARPTRAATECSRRTKTEMIIKNKEKMAKEEVNATKSPADIQEAIKKVNEAAGYDVPLAFAALNAAVINEQTTFDFGLFAGRADIATMADIVVRGRGNKIDSNTLAMLMETAMAYGWHWATESESMLRSDKVQKEIAEFVDTNQKLTVAEKVERKDGLERGFAAIRKAVEKTESRMKLQKAIK